MKKRVALEKYRSFVFGVLPPQARISIDADTDNIIVDDGLRGFCITPLALDTFPDFKMELHLIVAWNALRNGLDQDHHGVKLLPIAQLRSSCKETVFDCTHVGRQEIVQTVESLLK